MAGIVEQRNQLEQVLKVSHGAGLDVAAAVKEDERDLSILVAEPVGLDAAGEGNRLRSKVTLLSELVVCFCRGLVQVAGLREGDGAQLGAESGKGDIFEVGWCALGAFEWRGNQTSDGCKNCKLSAAGLMCKARDRQVLVKR